MNNTLPLCFGRIKHLNYENLEEIPGDVITDSNISVLYLKRNLLKTLSTNIYHMRSLVEINLDSNLITSLPHEFQLLSNLEKLDLKQNQLDHIPNVIFNLPKLKKLNLFMNTVKSIDKGISQLKTLTHLNVAFNKITRIPIEISQCTALVALNLENNFISVVPKQITHLKALEDLTLNDNKLILLPPALSFMKSLKTLDVVNNLINIHCARFFLSADNISFYYNEIDDGVFRSNPDNSEEQNLCEKFKFWYDLSLLPLPSTDTPISLKESALSTLYERSCFYNIEEWNATNLPRDLQEMLDCYVAICFTCNRQIFCSAFYLILNNQVDFPHLMDVENQLEEGQKFIAIPWCLEEFMDGDFCKEET